MRGNKLDYKLSQIVKSFYLFSLPLISIIGVLFYRTYQNSNILSILIILLSMIPLLVVFNKINNNFLMIAIISISVALLYCTSFNSNYLWGADSHQEYYFANLVKKYSFWDSEIPNNYNSMLSVVMLAPIISIISGISLIWVFKIIYPLVFSIVPLILYRLYKNQTNHKVSFLAVFFFISVFTYYTEMVGLARQQIGEIFFSLIILLLIDKNIVSNLFKRKILLYTYGASLILSHYSLSYIFIGSAIFVLLLYYIQKKIFAHNILKKFRGTYLNPDISTLETMTINTNFIIFLLIFNIGWYIFTSEAKTFLMIITLFKNISRTVFLDLFNPEAVQGLYILLSREKTYLHQITKIMHILMQFFISIGIIDTIMKKNKGKIKYEFISFSIFCFILNIFSLILPYLSSSLNTSRIYHITLTFLSPFSVLGIISIFKRAHLVNTINKETSLKFLSIILSIFLLFNTGFMYTLTNIDDSIVNPFWNINYGETTDRLVLYNSYTPIEDIASAKWLSKYRGLLNVFSDYRGRNNPLNAYSMISRNEVVLISETSRDIDEKSYVYIRKFNLYDNLMDGPRTLIGTTIVFNSTNIISELSKKGNIIYSNGGSVLYFTFELISLPQKN